MHNFFLGALPNDNAKCEKSRAELIINYSGIDRSAIQKVVRILSKVCF